MLTPDFILVGYEQGGTTLLSDIFRANGHESGFECGVLLADRPAALDGIEPFWGRLLSDWGLSEGERAMAVSGGFPAFYDRLFRHAFPDFGGRFFDKTPAYMERLGHCLMRAPFLRGAVAIHRDPRAVFASMARKIDPETEVGATVERHFAHLCARYLSYFAGLAPHLDDPGVLVLGFEDLLRDPGTALARLGRFVGGQPFRGPEASSRFDQVAPGGLQEGKRREFNRLLSAELQERILAATALAARFFDGAGKRRRHAAVWEETSDSAEAILHRHGLTRALVIVRGRPFSPLAYLLRYPDVLAAEVNPVEHYLRIGLEEGRLG